MVNNNKSLYSFLVMSILTLGLCLGSPVYSMGKKVGPMGAWLDPAGRLQHGSLLQAVGEEDVSVSPEAPAQQVVEEQNTYTIRNAFPFPIYVTTQISGRSMIKGDGEMTALLEPSLPVRVHVLSFIGLHPSAKIGLPYKAKIGFVGMPAPQRPVISVGLDIEIPADKLRYGGPIVFEVSAVDADGEPVTLEHRGTATFLPEITYPIKFIIRRLHDGISDVVAEKVISKEVIAEANARLP